MARCHAITLAATEHGGHLGFLAKKAPRFWVEQFVLQWLDRILQNQASGELTPIYLR